MLHASGSLTPCPPIGLGQQGWGGEYAREEGKEYWRVGSPHHVLSLPHCVLTVAELPPPGTMMMTLTELKLHSSLLLRVVMVPEESGSWLKIYVQFVRPDCRQLQRLTREAWWPQAAIPLCTAVPGGSCSQGLRSLWPVSILGICIPNPGTFIARSLLI